MTLLFISQLRKTLIALSGGLLSAATLAQDRVVYETVIDAPVETVWHAFSTPAGLQTWMAPLVDIDLSVGGKMVSNYNAEGTLGDESTIENTILAFDPMHMLALKATGFPAGFAFEEAARATWSIFYFAELPNDRTRITVVGLGYTEDAQSQQMRSFFADANAASLQTLAEALGTDTADDVSE